MKIFSQFVACCFVLVSVSFALLKLFIFKRSPLSTVDLKAWVTGVLFKKFCSVPIRSRALPTLLLLHSVYLVLCWCPGSILCRVIITINLILLYVHCQLDQHHLLKMLFFPTVWFLLHFKKMIFSLFFVYEYSVTLFRNTRRGHQIPLQMVMSHLVVVGILTQDLWKKSQLLTSVISPALVFASLSKIKCPYMCGFLLASLIVFNWSVCLSLYQ